MIDKEMRTRIDAAIAELQRLWNKPTSRAFVDASRELLDALAAAQVHGMNSEKADRIYRDALYGWKRAKAHGELILVPPECVEDPDPEC